MYKLLLILKYLRKRRIAWVSLLAVTLCTAMVLVVISVMGGWLRMFRTSFHGLSGEIIVQSDSLAGFPHYQELIQEIQKVPEVGGAVPVIATYGLININNRKTDGVQVLGYPIDQIGRVNDFPKSLYRQYQQWNEWADGAPISAGDRLILRQTLGLDGIREPGPLLALSREERDRLHKSLPDAGRKISELRARLNAAKDDLERTRAQRELNVVTEAEQTIKGLLDLPEGGFAGVMDREIIRQALGDVIDDADARLKPNDAERKLARDQAEKGVKNPSFDKIFPPATYKQDFLFANPRAKDKPQLAEDAANWGGLIAGIGVVNVHKDETGKLVNRGDFLYHIPVALTVMGVSPTGKFDIGQKAERNYWIVDTSRTKVWQYDSKTVYVPFDALQVDLGMNEQTAEVDGKPVTIPARTKEVHVRVKAPWASNTQDLIRIRDDIKLVVDKVLRGRGDVPVPPSVRTWEESQAKYIGAIEKEKLLVTFLFGMISVVAIFLIFCIFYMIVVEKTRDIGIIKSVGATSSGVAGIFLGYGATIGILGAALGFGIGLAVVRNINTIHDWLGKALGVVVWDPEVYAFDTIPNTMDPKEVTIILAVAIIASILGALVPAYRAARMHPVEALRWE